MTRGADINLVSDRGNTPLHTAVMWERSAAVKILLELGADINAKGEGGETAIEMAQKMFGDIMPAYEHSVITALKEFTAKANTK